MDLYWFVSVCLIVLILLAIAMFAAFYRRASKDMAHVRTGLGGERVIVNNGAFVFPVLHDTVPVNMKTLRVEISRSNNVALITKDPLRVDEDSGIKRVIFIKIFTGGLIKTHQ